MVFFERLAWLADGFMLLSALCCCSKCLIMESLFGSALLPMSFVTKMQPFYWLERLWPRPLIEEEMISDEGWLISESVFFTAAWGSDLACSVQGTLLLRLSGARSPFGTFFDCDRDRFTGGLEFVTLVRLSCAWYGLPGAKQLRLVIWSTAPSFLAWRAAPI